MVSLVLWLRLAKILSVLLLASGTIGTVVARDLRLRRIFAFALAGPGLGLTWVFGFLLAYVLGYSLFSPFIVGGIGLSLLGIQGVLYLAGREGRGGPVPALVALVPLVLVVWLMVFRPGWPG